MGRQLTLAEQKSDLQKSIDYIVKHDINLSDEDIAILGHMNKPMHEALILLKRKQKIEKIKNSINGIT